MAAVDRFCCIAIKIKDDAVIVKLMSLPGYVKQALFLYTSARKERMKILFLNTFLQVANFCHLLISFANSLDPDQARQMSGLIWIQTF